MKKRILPYLLLVLGLILLCYNYWPTPRRAITYQQRVEHRVIFMTDTGKKVDICTATAIGPHALLTAEHCNDRNTRLPQLVIDESFRAYHIIVSVVDNRDHVILLIDGPPFKNYLDIGYLLNKHPLRPGEVVRIWGNGGSAYPGRYREGTQDIRSQEDDPSDVDANDELLIFSMPVIGGDSGAAVFGEDGRLVCIVTYSITDDTYKPIGMSGFALAFPDKVLQFAQTFDPVTFMAQQPVLPVVGKPPKS